MTITHFGAAPGAKYTPVVVAGGLAFTAGQVGEDPSGSVPADFEAEVRLAFDNLEQVLADAGTDLNRLVQMTCYISDLELAVAFNAVYFERIPEPRPARAMVEVGMVPPYRIELVCVAAAS